MSTPAPLDPKVPENTPATTPEGAVPFGPTFEDHLREFWAKNSRLIYIVCTVILVVILARGAWDYYKQEQEQKVRTEFALASTPEKLKAFTADNPSHSLAAVAAMKLADDAYSAGNYTEAQVQYQKAIDILKDGPVAGRARLGLAISKLNGGQATEAEEKLKQLANDIGQLKTLRAEAAYHLATLAIEAGRTDDAVKHAELASTVDQGGMWAQRAMMLRATLPAPVATTPTGVTVPLPAKP